MDASALLNLDIDGKPVQVPPGSTVMEAANKLGIYIPHFCYHKKLSIAANCRMCLVQVEKAPKPLPACATPVTEGMKVLTHSVQAVDAQKGVMEFLLINHPLDCPICDQGGECQLQDLAVGYGASSSRYDEPKRVVSPKNIGPLVAAEEMTRCIHCTRCIRFGQEIAGVMELGMSGRGEHAEILAFVGATVDSELSGNMIDLCPVGALTSKPFRYTGRPWELVRRKSIAPHDALGSNLTVQVQHSRVKRVLPLENEAINECWLSDRDRFSYDALGSEARLITPSIRVDGQWQAVDWQSALEAVVEGLRGVVSRHGGDALGALVSAHSTLEELHLAARLVRGLGSDNIDFRLRHTDFSADGRGGAVPWLGTSIAELAALDRVLFVGGFARQDHPLLTNRFRQAVKKGQQFSLLHVVDDELRLPVAARSIVPPSKLPAALAEVLVASCRVRAKPVPAELSGVIPSPASEAIAASLASGSRVAVLLGNLAREHPAASQLHALARRLAEVLGATQGFTMEAAGSVGAYLAGALPEDGRNARSMLAEPRRGYLLLGVEPELDCADPRQAMQALAGAEFVVALSAFETRAREYAHVILPVAPFTETSGTFVNCEGRAQRFHGVVKPLGDTRPAWKVLRVLGTLLGVPGMEFDTSEAVRDAVLGGLDIRTRLDNDTAVPLAPAVTAATPAAPGSGPLQRIADVPLYSSDPLVRRSEPLQKTAEAQPPRARMHGSELAARGLVEGQAVRVRQGGGEATVLAARDDAVPVGCVRLAAAHASTSGLGHFAEPVLVEPATSESTAMERA